MSGGLGGLIWGRARGSNARWPLPRSKRLMGMTPGEQELSELELSRTQDPAGWESKEKQLAEQLLARLEEMQ